jgi:2'-5' RNA ligase
VSERLRLFVALELPREGRSALAEWAAAVLPLGVRPVPEENLHLTLAFLGSRSPADAEAVSERLALVAWPPEALATEGALWLPQPRPRVLAVALSGADDLEALRDRLVASLVRAIGFEVERRPFLAHVTVGRVMRDVRVDTRRELPVPLPQLSLHPVALTLFASRATADGVRYEALARVELMRGQS